MGCRLIADHSLYVLIGTKYSKHIWSNVLDGRKINDRLTRDKQTKPRRASLKRDKLNIEAFGYHFNLFEITWLFLMGCVLTIGSIERTLKAGEGKPFTAGFYALLVSISTWYSLTAAASEDCFAFAIFSAGTIFASMASGRFHSKDME